MHATRIGRLLLVLVFAAAGTTACQPDKPPEQLERDLADLNARADRLLELLENADLNDPATRDWVTDSLRALARAKFELTRHFPNVWGKPFSTWYSHLSGMDAQLDEGTRWADERNLDQVRDAIRRFKREKREMEGDVQ